MYYGDIQLHRALTHAAVSRFGAGMCPSIEALLAAVADLRLQAVAVLFVGCGLEVSGAKPAQTLLCQNLVPGSTAFYSSL